MHFLSPLGTGRHGFVESRRKDSKNKKNTQRLAIVAVLKVSRNSPKAHIDVTGKIFVKKGS